jgi:penicillin-binding protein 1A
MKWLVRGGLFFIGLVVVSTIAVLCWLYLYTADLPSISELAPYNPSTSVEIPVRSVDGMPSVRHVVPTELLGKYAEKALVSAEGQPEARGPIRATIAGLLSDVPPHAQMYSWRIARDFVSRGTSIRRQIDQIRFAQQIHRHFDQKQILTIYLNRVYLGENACGIEDAAMRYFGKHAADLLLDEVALLAGLIRSPNRDSPINHPERAVERRNGVIEEMMRQGSVSREEAENARMAALIVKKTPNSEAAYDFERCAVKILPEKPKPHETVRIRSGDRYLHDPVVAFQVLESGAIRNAVLSRTSGLKEVDDYALSWVKGVKYRPRPAGCGVLESQMSMTVDFR